MTEDLGAMLGGLLATGAGPAAALVRDTVALLCRERTLGHVCVSLEDHAATPRGGTHEPFPDAEAWRAALLQTGLVGTDDADDDLRPLALDGLRLYLRRDRDAERRIVGCLRERLGGAPLVAPEDVGAALRRLGEAPAAADGPDWQLAALGAGAGARFLLLTGGPGTGKTSTVARLLSLLLVLEPGARIALCAPTGKAAARLGEAIGAHAARDPRLAAALPRLAPQTLHRLLGYLPSDDAFRSGPERPLALDAVVVDEASMLDPALLAVLLEALPARARLVLVGDRDQLAAVAAGQVLGDLCRAAEPERGAGPGLAAFVRAATGLALPVRRDAPPIADAVVALRVNWRFGAQPGLDHFAQALAARDPRRALATLAAGHPDLRLLHDADGALAAVGDELDTVLRDDPAAAVAALSSMRVLCATRHGEGGTGAWNRRVEALLRRRGVCTDDPWYPGRPILVTANDHQNRVFNGDLGVVCRRAGARAQVAFPTPGGGARLVSPFRLPAHETAWAMTVHKAQGSEFDTVVLGMPDVDGPLWQAPLLYTGVTRARRRALLVADRELLGVGIARWPARGSGLAAALGRG